MAVYSLLATKDGRVIWLQTPSIFWLGGGTIPLIFVMYMELVILGR